MISFSDHIRQAVGTSATETKKQTPCPKWQGFLLVAVRGGAPSGTPNHSKVYKSIPTTYKYFHQIENLKTSFLKKFSRPKMLKKDEVSKYTVPKNALDMLEWPPYSSKYTAKDIPTMTDSNINPPNPVPGTEVTTSPGLVPETVPTYDPNTVNVDTAVPNVVVPPSVTGTEWDGTIAPPAGQPDITEVPPTEYAAAVDNLVNEMPVATETQQAHQEMMHQPAYAIATHEHQLNKISDLLEELCTRVVSIEAKLMEHDQLHNDIAHPPADSNNPINDYPEVQAHQNK